jgi:hypothetical protein
MAGGGVGGALVKVLGVVGRRVLLAVVVVGGLRVVGLWVLSKS